MAANVGHETEREAALAVIDSLECNYKSNPGVPYAFHPFSGNELEYIELGMSGTCSNAPIFKQPIYFCYEGEIPESVAALDGMQGTFANDCVWDTNASITVIGTAVADAMKLCLFAKKEEYEVNGDDNIKVNVGCENIRLKFKTRNNGEISVVLSNVVLSECRESVIGNDVTMCLCHAYFAHPNDLNGSYWMYDTRVYGKTVHAETVMQKYDYYSKKEMQNDKKETSNENNEKYQRHGIRRLKKLPRSMCTPPRIWATKMVVNLHPFRFFPHEYYQAIKYINSYSKYYPKIPKHFDCKKFFSKEQKDLVDQWEVEQRDRILAAICKMAKDKDKAKDALKVEADEPNVR